MENTFYQTKEAFLKSIEALAIERDSINASYHIALTLLDDMAAIAWKDAAYMSKFLAWLQGKDYTTGLMTLLEPVKRYNSNSLSHFNAFSFLDNASLHFNTKIKSA